MAQLIGSGANQVPVNGMLGTAAFVDKEQLPVSDPQQVALNLKANLASPALTGTPTAPTAAAGTNTTQIATTAFVNAEIVSDIATKANLASPALTGTPTAPTAAVGTNTTQLATTAFVNAEIANDAPTKTGGGASGTWPISVTGSAPTLTTARTINGAPFDGSVDIKTTEWFHSARDFPNGTLVTTSIDYSAAGGDPWVLEIKGNSYVNQVPFDIQYQGYIYNDSITNHGGYSNGTGISGLVALNVGGALCFWWPTQSYWHGYNVRVYAANATYPLNRVVNINDTAKPTGTKEVALSAEIRQSLHSSNYNSYSPTLTGGNASGTWPIAVTGNAATATKLATARTVNGVSFDGSANISIDAAAVPHTPSGSISATTVQAAINELDSEKVATTAVIAIANGGTGATSANAAADAIGAFRRGTLLGTVSQSAGVPTGAVIERGSNANGEYVRFADGTQICTSTVTVPAWVAAGTSSVSWAFPAAFVAVPSVVALLNTDRPQVYNCSTFAVLAGSAAIAAGGSDASGVYATGATHVQAVGRWF